MSTGILLKRYLLCYVYIQKVKFEYLLYAKYCAKAPGDRYLKDSHGKSLLKGFLTLLVRLSILFLPDFLRIVFYKLYPELII
jgi:hypothetical protein